MRGPGSERGKGWGGSGWWGADVTKPLFAPPSCLSFVAPTAIVARLACSPLCHISMEFPVRYKKAGVNFTEPKTMCGHFPPPGRAKESAKRNAKMYTKAREMMCYTKVFHNKHKAIRLLTVRLFGPASLQCTGAEEGKGGGRRGEAEGLWCHRPGPPARPDGVMGTASCGLNYNTQWRRRLGLFFFWDTQLNRCVKFNVFKPDEGHW